jgi:fumarate reductase (CoM/CoB) subunit A
MRNVKGDVVILGGGLAGCVAAIEARKHGVGVILVDNWKVGCAGSASTSGGSPEAILPPSHGGHPEDSIDKYVEDIVVGGDYISNQHMTAVVGAEVAATVLELDAIGVPYIKRDGLFVTYQTLGSSHPRVGRLIGNGTRLMQVLRREVLHRGVVLLENTYVTRLFEAAGRLRGAYALDRDTGQPVIITAGALVIASGSALDLYPVSTANHRNCGDGYTLAWEMGCRLINMEFVEFSVVPAPGGVPIATGGIKPTLAAGAHVYNRLGERFLQKVDAKRLEMTNRARLVRAIFEEMKEGRGPCVVDTRMLADSPTRFMRRCKTARGFDYTKQPIEITLAAHSFLGGIRVDTDGRTDLEGLFAAGEAAGHGGAFGADRVNGAIGACQVLGRRAGRAAAQYALGHNRRSIRAQDIRAESRRLHRLAANGEKLQDIARRIHMNSTRTIGILRDAESLLEGIGRYQELRRASLSAKGEITKKLQLANLSLVGELVARAALARQETRGQHRRSDFPERNDDDWLSWVVLNKAIGEPEIRHEPIPIATYKFKPPSRDVGRGI